MAHRVASGPPCYPQKEQGRRSFVLFSVVYSSLNGKKEEANTMIDKIEAIVLFVQDLAACTAFYRDTFKLNYQGTVQVSPIFRLKEGFSLFYSLHLALLTC